MAVRPDGQRIPGDTYKLGFADRRDKLAKRWAADDRLANGRALTTEEIGRALGDAELLVKPEVEAALGRDDDDDEKKPPKIVTASFTNKRLIVELAYNTELKGPDFIVYDRDAKSVRRTSQVKFKRRTLVPPSAWVGMLTPGGSLPGTVFVPTKYDERGLDEADLRESVQGFIHRYVELPDDGEALAVEYVLLTWVHDGFDELPYLAFRTADFGRGKSRGLETVGSICYRPILCGGGSTAAALLRLVDAFGGSLLCDEFDARDTDLASAVAKLINQGFQKNRPIVKCDGDDSTPRPFRCFGPKLFALRKGLFDDASESRTLSIYMRQRTRRKGHSAVPINLPRRKFDAEARRLRNMLLAWRFERLGQITIDPDHADDGLEDRFNQIGLPLLAVAGEKRRGRIVAALTELQGNMADRRADTWSCEIFEAALATADPCGVVRPGAVAAEVNRRRSAADGIDIDRLGKRRLTAEKAGWTMKRQLEFIRERGRAGTTYRFTEDRRRELCLRFGIPWETLSRLQHCNTAADCNTENGLFDSASGVGGSCGSCGSSVAGTGPYATETVTDADLGGSGLTPGPQITADEAAGDGDDPPATERVAAPAADPEGAEITGGDGAEVPAGWEPRAWADNLDRLAGLCSDLHPDRAADYRQQAAAIRAANPSEPDPEIPF